jgi:hypothetical protein
MEWVTKPVVDNSLFELFAGEESAKVTTFTPGRMLKVSLRTKKYDNQFNGILLYAIDAADTTADPAKVGRWEFTDTEDRFHSFCPGTVLHANAALKPYLTTWRFEPPADFTGSIKFVALIKVGPANDGAFYYPNNVVLSPTGAAPTLAEQWYRGANNKTCDEVCAAVATNFECDDAKITTINTAAEVENIIAPYVTCRRPLLARCTAQGLSTSPDGFCFYPNNAECTAAGLTTTATTCAARATGLGTRRICPCKCKAGATCTASVTTAAGTTRATTRVGGTTRATTRAPARTTTRAQGTGVPATAAGTVAPTLPPVPVCSKTLGCVCDKDGLCNSGLQCMAQGDQSFCVKEENKPTCTFGELGCFCREADQGCSDALECKDQTCVRKTGSQCVDGLLGCPCTDECMRPDAHCVKTAGATEGVCALAVDISNACEAGTLGCPCKQGSCGEDFTCRIIGRNELCVDMRVFSDSQVASASSLSAIVATMVAVVMALAL